MNRVAIYPGTFDPLTNGHLDIIDRSKHMFDKIIVAIAESSSKKPMFSLKDREEMVRLATKEMENIEVMVFGNLLADFAKEMESNFIIRGLRVVSDFEYELQMGYSNRTLNPALETIYFMPSLKNAFISSTVVRTIMEHNGKISHLVPESVFEFICKNIGICK